MRLAILAALFTLASFNVAVAGDASMPKVQDVLDKKKSEFSASAAPKMKSDFEEGIQLVRDSGVEEKARQVGDKAPNFTLPNATGEDVTLYEVLKEGPVVITWYRGGWCPYCNLYLHELQEVLPQFKAAGAQLIAISPELPDNSADTKQKNELSFHVLSDVQNKSGKDFGVVFELPAFIADYYNAAFDLVKYNGDDSNELPLSASYVIAQDGTIAYAFLDADYRKRAEPADLLKAIEALK